MSPMRMFKPGYLLAACITAAGTFGIACGPDQRIMQSGKGSPSPSATADQRSSTEQELASMRNAGFSHIYVIRRKDGGPLDPDDKAVLRQQTYEANRRVSAEDGKAVIVGSNFQITVTNMGPLAERFAVQDFSPPQPASTPEPGNSNAVK
jgi:hypothetical protein